MVSESLRRSAGGRGVGSGPGSCSRLSTTRWKVQQNDAFKQEQEHWLNTLAKTRAQILALLWQQRPVFPYYVWLSIECGAKASCGCAYVRRTASINRVVADCTVTHDNAKELQSTNTVCYVTFQRTDWLCDLQLADSLLKSQTRCCWTLHKVICCSVLSPKRCTILPPNAGLFQSVPSLLFSCMAPCTKTFPCNKARSLPPIPYYHFVVNMLTSPDKNLKSKSSPAPHTRFPKNSNSVSDTSFCSSGFCTQYWG